MSNLDDARAENTAFDLLEMRQNKRAKVKQRLDVIRATYDTPKNTYTVKEQDDEK
tara:strand:- start:1340 stop:1504 length:165 start_codon:yes stop_codon:yes gene_type:complete